MKKNVLCRHAQNNYWNCCHICFQRENWFMSLFSLTKDKDGNWHNPLLPRPTQQISRKNTFFRTKSNISMTTDYYRWWSSVNFGISFWCLQSDKKTQKIFLRIFALDSEKRSNQKSSVTESKWNHPISDIKCSYFFSIWLLFKG